MGDVEVDESIEKLNQMTHNISQKIVHKAR